MGSAIVHPLGRVVFAACFAYECRMLGRHIVSYLPSQVLPALISMLLILVYTHLMSPEQYGYYTLIINGHLFFTVVCYGWLHNVVLRLAPQAARQNDALRLRGMSYLLFIALSVLGLVGTALFVHLSPHIGWIIWLACALGISRGLLTLIECWHRAQLHINRFNLLECGQAVLGMIAGVGLVYGFQAGAVGGTVGMIASILVMLLVDRKQITLTRLSKSAMPMIREIFRIGAPLFASSLLVYTLTSVDRFLVEYYQGPTDLGMYAAGYILVDRIIQVLFLVIAMASYSLTVHRLEHEGIEAARAQTYRNGIGILALTLPATVGLIFCAPALVNVMIGEAYRPGALAIMPWVAVAAFFYGLATHYFDHAFFLMKKTHLFLFTQGPSAVLYIVLNILLIPRYGILGAAYATLAAYALLLLLSIMLGRRIFKIHFPFLPALKIAMATLLMALVLWNIDFPYSLLGLIAQATLGVGIYGLAILALDVEGARHQLRKIFRVLQRSTLGE